MREKKNNKNCRAGFFERMSTGLDIDCDMLCRGFSAELRGKNRAEICGVKRILTYTDSEISFVSADGIFSVRGRRLFCLSYKRGAVIVEGDISEMGFFDGGSNGNT